MTDLAPGPAGDARIAEAMGNVTRCVRQDELGTPIPEMRPAGCSHQLDWAPIPAYTTNGNGLLAMLIFLRDPERDWETNMDMTCSTVCIEVHGAGFDAIAHAAADTINLAVGEALLAAVEDADGKVKP